MFITHNQQRPKVLTWIVDAVVLSPTRKEFSNLRRVLTRPNDKNCFIVIAGYSCPTASILWCRGRLVQLSSVIELTEKFQFDYVRFPNQSYNNQTDWVRLIFGSVSFDWLRYNPGQKSLGQFCNIHIFLSFLGSLLKHRILLEIFLQFALPPPYTKLKLEKNSGYTRPRLFVGWGEGLDLWELVWAIFLPRVHLWKKQTPGSRLIKHKLKLQAWRLRIFGDTIILVFVNENCSLCICFTELIIFLSLIVSSLSCNFNRFAVCFQSFSEHRLQEYSNFYG